jgi:hypothetical protein
MEDPIVDEIKKRREDYVKKFNYDFNLIAEDLKKKQAELKKQGYKFVKLQPKLHKKAQAA